MNMSTAGMNSQRNGACTRLAQVCRKFTVVSLPVQCFLSESKMCEAWVSDFLSFHLDCFTSVGLSSLTLNVCFILCLSSYDRNE